MNGYYVGSLPFIRESSIIEESKIIVRGSDIERAVFFSMVAEIPSGPEEVQEGN